MVAAIGRDLVFMTTAWLSDLSVPLKGEVQRSPEQSARQPIARSDKFARRAYSRRALVCEKTTVLCFLPSWSTLLFERGLGKRVDLMLQPAVKHQRPAQQNHKQQLLRPRSGARKEHIPEQPGWKISKWSTEQISKKGIKLILKTIGNRKGDCAWSCSRWQTPPEKICKLQSTNQYNVRSK